MAKDKEKSELTLDNRFENQRGVNNRSVKEKDREQLDKSFTDNGTKFTLGTEGEYQGFQYPAMFKIRSKEVKYDNDFKQYTTKISYSTVARMLAWLKQPENKEVFNELVRAEKLKNEGTPEFE